MAKSKLNIGKNKVIYSDYTIMSAHKKKDGFILVVADRNSNDSLHLELDAEELNLIKTRLLNN